MSRHRIAPTGPSRRPRGTKAGRAAVLAATDRVVNHLRGLYAELEGLPRREDGGVSIPRELADRIVAICDAMEPLGIIELRHLADRLRRPLTITPEQTLREAGIDDARQAKYQRRMSALLAGRPLDGLGETGGA